MYLIVHAYTALSEAIWSWSDRTYQIVILVPNEPMYIILGNGKSIGRQSKKRMHKRREIVKTRGAQCCAMQIGSVNVEFLQGPLTSQLSRLSVGSGHSLPLPFSGHIYS